jgi:hypothetical protein
MTPPRLSSAAIIIRKADGIILEQNLRALGRKRYRCDPNGTNVVIFINFSVLLCEAPAAG